jgi:hypothetical protein
MKKYIYAALLVCLALLLQSCDERVPLGKDWNFEFSSTSVGQETDYYFKFSGLYLGDDSSVSVLDNYRLTLDSLNVPLDVFLWDNEMFIQADVFLQWGTTYHATFKRNGAVIFSTDITTPYFAMLSYPATFNPNQDQPLNWVMSGSNQQQQVYISAENTNLAYPRFVEKYINLSPSLRAYTIPANIVPAYGVYTLGLIEANNYQTDKASISTRFTIKKYY